MAGNNWQLVRSNPIVVPTGTEVREGTTWREKVVWFLRQCIWRLIMIVALIARKILGMSRMWQVISFVLALLGISLLVFLLSRPFIGFGSSEPTVSEPITMVSELPKVSLTPEANSGTPFRMDFWNWNYSTIDIIGLSVLGVLILVTLIVLVAKIIQFRNPKITIDGEPVKPDGTVETDPDGTTAGDPATSSKTGSTPTKPETKSALISRKFDEWRNKPWFYAAQFTIGWFFLTRLFWLFESKTTAWNWPGNGVTVWHWLSVDHRVLYLHTSWVILVGVWFVLAKPVLLRTVGSLMWAVLGLFWVTTLFTTTKNSPAWAIITAPDKAELDNPELTPHRDIKALPGEWSDNVPIPDFYNGIWHEQGKIKIELTHVVYEGEAWVKKICELEDWPGNGDQWRPENVIDCRFMSLEKHPVDVGVDRYRRHLKYKE